MTEENQQYLRDNYLMMLDREMAEVLGCTRGTVSAWCRRLGLVRPPEIVHKRKSRIVTEERRQRLRELYYTNEKLINNRFQLGAKGHYYPIGARVKERKDGYWRIKVADEPFTRKNWQYEHRVLWEKHYGAIPEGHHIIFLDGNKDNIVIENLYMIDNRLFGIMNAHYKFTDNPRDTISYIELAKLKLAIADAKRRKREKVPKSTV